MFKLLPLPFRSKKKKHKSAYVSTEDVEECTLPRPLLLKWMKAHPCRQFRSWSKLRNRWICEFTKRIEAEQYANTVECKQNKPTEVIQFIYNDGTKEYVVCYRKSWEN